MADDLAFPPQDLAFTPDAGGDNDAASQAAQRNEQIQQAFETQRFQRSIAQGMGAALQKQAARSAQQQAEIERLSAKRAGGQ